MLHSRSRSSAGFTIIELSVVIAVIASLAVLTFVGYGSWRDRTTETTIKSELAQIASSLESARNWSDGSTNTYPSDCNAGTIALSEGNTLDCEVSADGNNYCTTITNGEMTYYLSNTDSTAVEGNCESVVLAWTEGGGGGGGGGSGGGSTSEACFTFDATYQTITGYYLYEGNNASNPACPRDVVIPATIGGTPVLAIGDSAFYFKSLTSVVIPEGVETIWQMAFSYNDITSVTFPSSLVTIDQYAFETNNLDEVYLYPTTDFTGFGVFDPWVVVNYY